MPNHTGQSVQSEKLLLEELLQQNRLTEAKELLTDMCRRHASDAQVWFLYGAVNQQLGLSDIAESAYLQAIAVQPSLAVAHYQLGTLRLESGQTDQAAKNFRRAVEIQENFIEAWANLGYSLEQAGRFTEALDCYRRALQLDPKTPELHFNVAKIQQVLGNHSNAELHYREAIRLRPDYIEAHEHLGIALASQNKHDEAIASYRRALAVRPDHGSIHYHLAISLKEFNRLDEAIDSYRRAIAINPGDADAHLNLGVALMKQKQFCEATIHYHESLRLKPDNGDAYNNLGLACAAQELFCDALSHYKEALRLQPDNVDVHFNLGLLFLLQGDFRNGWGEYPWRWKHPDKPPRPFVPTSWNRKHLDGRNIFLYAEQGLGDELFFLRFIPWLKQCGAGKIIYRPSTQLSSLLSRSTVIDRIADLRAKPDANDFVFSIGDLPQLLGMERVDQIPRPLGLTPDTKMLGTIQARLAACGIPPYIGITWRAGSPQRNALHKEIPISQLARLLHNVPGTLLVLQRHPAPGEVEAFARALGRPVHDLSALNDDLEQMLALLSLIDEYVGVSNTNMHLRAGVGKTARVLVPAPPEWRWMAEGKESPWFPGFRVYRQLSNGDWGPAVTELEQELAE